MEPVATLLKITGTPLSLHSLEIVSAVLYTVSVAPLETLTLDGEFNTAKDKGMYAGSVDFIKIRTGYCYVAFPEDGHMPNLHLEEKQHLKKLVLKLKV